MLERRFTYLQSSLYFQKLSLRFRSSTIVSPHSPVRTDNSVTGNFSVKVFLHNISNGTGSSGGTGSSRHFFVGHSFSFWNFQNYVPDAFRKAWKFPCFHDLFSDFSYDESFVIFSPPLLDTRNIRNRVNVREIHRSQESS